MRRIVSNILFIAGIFIMLSPFILRGITYFNKTNVISNYRKNINSKTEEELKSEEEKIKQYNDRLSDDKPTININEHIDNNLRSNFDFFESGEVIGTLLIPSINVDLPIYDGVSDENLQRGVSHLDNTSYPTGDINTHAVFAGHSGLTNSKILDDLDKLEIGDKFQIEYLNKKTSYEVTNIQVVLPYETDSLNIVGGECLVTLVTCTPISINTHRLLVTAKKIEDNIENVNMDSKIVIFLEQNYIFVLLIVLMIVILIVIIVRNKKNKNI